MKTCWRSIHQFGNEGGKDGDDARLVDQRRRDYHDQVTGIDLRGSCGRNSREKRSQNFIQVVLNSARLVFS